MKKLNVAMALCVAGTLAATVASAGYKYVATLTIDTVNRKASGSLADTRATADTLSYIGCRLDASNSGSAVTVYCAAQDANRVQASCYSSAPNLVQVVSAMHSDSILVFTWDANNTCTSINVENWSQDSPMRP